MTTQHTPGPWSIDGSVNAGNLDVINGEGRIAMIDDSRSTGWNVPTINANARLIAAAPDMLAMLHEVIALLNNPDADGTDANRVEREILAVIAKATGDAQ
jgi:hypothetical protein